MKTIMATGHRPEMITINGVEERVFEYLKERSENEKITLVSGMCRGWDIIVARVSKQLDIPLLAFVPFPNYEKAWNEDEKLEYEEILTYAEDIHFTSNKYYRRVFLDRDDEMISISDEVIALWNPEIKKGGTFYTRNKAVKKGLVIHDFWK